MLIFNFAKIVWEDKKCTAEITIYKGTATNGSISEVSSKNSDIHILGLM